MNRALAIYKLRIVVTVLAILTSPVSAEESPNYSRYLEKQIVRPDGEVVTTRQLLGLSPTDSGSNPQLHNFFRENGLDESDDYEFAPIAPFPVSSFLGYQYKSEFDHMQRRSTCFVASRTVSCEFFSLGTGNKPHSVSFLEPVTSFSFIMAGGVNYLPEARTCAGRLTIVATGENNRCPTARTGKADASPKLAELVKGRMSHIGLPDADLAYVSAESISNGAQQIEALQALAKYSDPTECKDSRCGVFRRTVFQGNSGIDYCGRTVSGPVSFLEEDCHPLASFQNGKWHLVVVLSYSTFWESGGAEGDWACSITLPTKSLPKDYATQVASFAAPPLKNPEFRPIGKSNFIVTAAADNLAIKVFDSSLPNFGSAKVIAFGIRDGSNISLYFKSDFIISPRKMREPEDGFIPTYSQSSTLQYALNSIFDRNLKSKFPGSKVVCDLNFGGV